MSFFTRSLRPLACALALTTAFGSCLQVDHFTGDASRYDGLYFAPEKDVPLAPSLREDRWRNYAVFGLAPWDGKQLRFAGYRLAQTDQDRRPTEIVVHTELSFLNGAAAVGLAMVGAFLQPLLFVPRTTAVVGWQKSSGGKSVLGS